MVFTNFCTRVGMVLKVCTREGRGFCSQICTIEGRVFQRICVNEGNFATFQCYVPLLLWYPTFWTPEIVSFYIKDFNRYCFLPVVLQFTKGLLFEDYCTTVATISSLMENYRPYPNGKRHWGAVIINWYPGGGRIFGFPCTEILPPLEFRALETCPPPRNSRTEI